MTDQSSSNDLPKPDEYDFPISDYYRGHILGAQTLSQTGGWWTAILLIQDPRNQKPFVGLYRWQKTASGWKMRKRFTFNKREMARKGMDVLEKFIVKLE